MIVRKTTLRTLALLLTGFVFAHSVQAQINSRQFNTLLQDFRTYHENIPVEKIFLHLDKTQYVQGETIWFKSYLVAGSGHLPSDFSKNVYVELLPAEGEPTEIIILRSEKGLANGSIKINKDLPPGDYYLRAYTQWMKNEGEAYFFRKKVKIHALDRSEILAGKGEYVPLDLKFYPEGGHLVKNVASYVAFEMQGTKLRKPSYNGSLYNKKGELVTTFSLQHERMGKFDFVPRENGYYATIEGFDQKFPLPEVKETGMVMLVDNMKDDYLNVTVKTDQPSANKYYLVAHTRGYITFASAIKLQKGRTFTRIEKNSLPEGITHITLMTEELQPLAERLAFINKQKGLDIQVTANKSAFASRELVNLDIEVKDENGKPVQGSFSLSAFDALVDNDQTINDIRANMLLSSDIRGYIHNPGQYLRKDEATARKLDLLLMVKGWSKFSWDALQNYQNREFMPPETGIRLTGRLMTEQLKSAKNSRVVLINSNDPNATIMAISDEAGRFEFQNQFFYDTTRLMFQAFQKKTAKNLIVTMDSTLKSVPFTPFDPTLQDNDPLRTDMLKQRLQTKVYSDSIFEKRNGFYDLGTVTIEARKEGIRDLRIRDARVTGVIDDTDFKEIPYDEKRIRDPYELMVGRVPGLMLSPLTGNNAGGTSAMRQPTFGIGERRKGPPLIFIDGYEANYQDVYGLEANAIDYVLSSRGNPGLISIYTLDNRRYNELGLKPGLLMKKLPGYHLADEFYAPVYDGTNANRDLPDQRTTIHWSPMLTTDKNGKASLSFYTPDQSTRMVIDIQGLSRSGNSGAANQSFTIGAK